MSAGGLRTAAEGRAPSKDGEALAAVQALLAGDRPLTWVFTGDSITQGALHTHGARGYVEHFAERVRWEMRRTRDVVINTAMSGHRTGHLLEDFDWRIARFKPDVVSIMIGTNDAVAGPDGLDRFRRELVTLIERCRALDAIVILSTPNPIDTDNGSGRPRRSLETYVHVIREVASRHDVILIDHWAAWLRASQSDQPPASWLNDPIHPGSLGHLAIAQEIFRTLDIFDENAPTCRALTDGAAVLSNAKAQASSDPVGGQRGNP